MTPRRPSVRLICWNESRAAELATELEAGGFTVNAEALDGPGLRAIGQSPPDAVVIDLGRLPAQGRDVGVTLRTTAAARHTPLVFVDGAEDKVARARQVLPDATYSDRENMVTATRSAVAEPPANPVVPESAFAGYSGTPLPRKLGIKTGSTVALVRAPKGFERTLGKLPEGSRVVRRARDSADVTLWFVRSLSDLRDRIDSMAGIAGDGRLWICWPKRASGITSDVTQTDVRATGLAAGLVDFKICAIDATWSGLCFTRRKGTRGAPNRKTGPSPK